jgi:hypothetical protein
MVGVMAKYDSQGIPELEIYPWKDTDPQSKVSTIVKNSGISDFGAHLEVWTSGASNKSLAYFSHGIFRYYGKFPPPIARHLITRYTSPGDLVLDPTSGSGTTALEALLLKRKAFCFDVNPLSVLLTKVKVTKLDKSRYLGYLSKVFDKIVNYRSLEPISLPGLKDPDHWFLHETRVSLTRIKYAIEEIDAPEEYKNAMEVAFLSTVRPVSKATTQQGRLFLDVASAQKDASIAFKKKAIELINSLSLLPSRTEELKVEQLSILEGTGRIRLDATPALIICHPPYFNAYKYSSINSLELAWMGVDHSKVRTNEIRESFKRGIPEKVTDYLDDMENALRNLRTSMSPKSVLALMIGDTVLKGNYMPVTKWLIERLNDAFIVDHSAIRVPQFTEASWSASQRRNGQQIGINLCDLIIILRKK